MARFILASIFIVGSFIAICAEERTCRKKCGSDEFCNTCGDRCEVECSRRPFKPCPKICDSPACMCKRGMYRDDNTKKCVPADKCSVPPKN